MHMHQFSSPLGGPRAGLYLQNFTGLNQSLSHASGSGASIGLRHSGIEMKQVLIWSGAVLVVVVLGVLIARADSRMWHRWHHGRNPVERMSSELNLNSAQKSQIKSMWETERPSIATLVREFAAESKEMESITRRGNFDQGKIQAIADRQGATVAQLLIQKQKLQSQIYTVLTPAQRTKADELEKRWDSRIDWIANRLEHSKRS